MKRILGFAMVLLMVSTMSLYGQESRVNLVGSSVMVSSDNSNWGLEVGGKLVVGKEYASFETKDGKFFTVTDKAGKMGVCDDKGSFIFPCRFFKMSVSGSGTISLITTSGAKPKFYKTSDPSVEVKATEMTVASLEAEIEKKAIPGTYYNAGSARQEAAIKEAEEASTAAPVGAFSLVVNSKGTQDVVVDGKVLFTADNFRLISDVANYKRTNCWFLVVAKGRSYGLFGLAIYEKDGEKVIDSRLFIPYEYSGIFLHRPGVVKCNAFAGDKYFTFTGKPAQP